MLYHIFYFAIGVLSAVLGLGLLAKLRKKKLNYEKSRAVFVTIIEFVIYATEKVMVLSILLFLIYWSFKIFILGADTSKAKAFVEFCTKNWIGVLIFAPFMFYRIIIQKLQELSEIASAKFRNLKPTPMKEGDATTVEVEK